MKVHMPIEPDMQNQVVRTIKAELPDDTTQKEFWDFVAMTAVSLFGERSPCKRGIMTEWDLVGSFKAWLEGNKNGRLA